MSNLSKKLIINTLLIAINLLFYSLLLAKENMPPEVKEAKIKTAMIYQILKLINWPEKKQTLSVCIIGEQGYLGNEFLKLDRKISNGRQISIVRRTINSPLDKLCDAVLIQDNNVDTVNAILHKINNKPVLSISDEIDFVKQGGFIEIYRIGERIKFLVNKDAALKTELQIDEKLLKLSK